MAKLQVNPVALAAMFGLDIDDRAQGLPMIEIPVIDREGKLEPGDKVVGVIREFVRGDEVPDNVRKLSHLYWKLA